MTILNIYFNLEYRQMGIFGTAGVTWEENFNLVLASLTVLAFNDY